MFGSVKVSNAGEAMISTYRPDLITRKQRLDVTHPGEYYQVNCPRCSDTRHRLYINHRWGVKDDQGHINLWLAVCFNEGCYTDYQNRADLFEDVSGADTGALTHAKPRRGRVLDADARKVTPPGPMVRLDKLSDDHPACAYLANRFYSPERLGRFYGVSYCPTSMFYLAKHRIIAPVYMDGKLKGWQARYIGDMNWKRKDSPPKWWSCPQMQRGRVLYNLDNAKKYEVGVIVEGPGDVWGVGPMGTATFGDTMTDTQRRLFVKAFKGRQAVLMFDPEAMVKKSVGKLTDFLRKEFGERFVPITLPEGTDPGGLDRKFLRSYMRDEARKLGVKLSFKLRE
jgi:hypothetical protein